MGLVEIMEDIHRKGFGWRHNQEGEDQADGLPGALNILGFLLPGQDYVLYIIQFPQQPWT